MTARSSIGYSSSSSSSSSSSPGGGGGGGGGINITATTSLFHYCSCCCVVFSLVSEAIPLHGDYRRSPQGNKLYLIKRTTNPIIESKQTIQPVVSKYGYHGPTALSLAKPVEEHLRRIPLNIPQPKEETLSKHSILGPTGLRGQWQPPTTQNVQYPSNVDLTPLQIPSNIKQPIKDDNIWREDDGISEQETSCLDPAVQPKNDNQASLNQESDFLISFDTVESSAHVEVIRQPSPPPVLTDVRI